MVMSRPLIIPYKYQCMAVSLYAREVPEFRDIRNRPRLVLLPKYFDEKNPKVTPQLHLGAHLGCICLPNLWPLSADLLEEATVLLVANVPMPQAVSYRKLPRCIVGGFVVSEAVLKERGQGSRCKMCVLFKDGVCGRKMARKYVELRFNGIYLFDEPINFPTNYKNYRNMLHLGRRVVVNRRDKIYRDMCELGAIKALEEADYVRPDAWWKAIREAVALLHEKGLLRAFYERYRANVSFLGLTKLIEDVLERG